MSDKEIIRLHTASMVEIQALKVFLEENNIGSMTRDEFSEGLSAGIPAGIPDAIDLYVFEDDFEDAVKLLQEFKT